MLWPGLNLILGMPLAASVKGEIQEKETLILKDVKRSENHLLVVSDTWEAHTHTIFAEEFI